MEAVRPALQGEDQVHRPREALARAAAGGRRAGRPPAAVRKDTGADIEPPAKWCDPLAQVKKEAPCLPGPSGSPAWPSASCARSSPPPSPPSTARPTCAPRSWRETNRQRRASGVLRHKTEREATATALRVGRCSAASWPRPSAPWLPRGCWTSAALGDDAWLPVATVTAGALLVGVLASLMEVTMRGLANAGPDRWALRLSGLVSALVFLFYPPMRHAAGRAQPRGAHLRPHAALRAPASAAGGAGEAARRAGRQQRGGQERPAAHPLHLRAVRQALPRRDGAAHRGRHRGDLHPARPRCCACWPRRTTRASPCTATTWTTSSASSTRAT